MGGNLFPSINTRSGLFLSFNIALFIANRLAFKILSFSISLTEAWPMDQIESFFINFDSISLLFREIFLESFRFFLFIDLFKITAAA